MNARFLRDEAARFRGMVDDTDREATKLRLLAMAAEYEERARSANELAGPNLDEADNGSTEPNLEQAIKVVPASIMAKETVAVQRRPVGRPRRE
jgi:hypothetical protein